VYKIVTKVIVSRIRPLLSNLISPYQTIFVPGRRGVDNVVIAQELIHTIHKKKGRVGHFMLKIDLEKAYDRIKWSFIREVLILFKFPMSLVNLILECISSSSSAILFNGANGGFSNFSGYLAGRSFISLHLHLVYGVLEFKNL
jgi:hypothetical protein